LVPSLFRLSLLHLLGDFAIAYSGLIRTLCSMNIVHIALLHSSNPFYCKPLAVFASNGVLILIDNIENIFWKQLFWYDRSKHYWKTIHIEDTPRNSWQEYLC